MNIGRVCEIRRSSKYNKESLISFWMDPDMSSSRLVIKINSNQRRDNK